MDVYNYDNVSGTILSIGEYTIPVGGVFDGTPILTVKSGSTVNLWMSGAKVGDGIAAGGTALIDAGGTLNPKSAEIRIDVSAAGVGKVAGNVATHIGSTNPGLAYATGTQWKRVSDDAIIV